MVQETEEKVQEQQSMRGFPFGMAEVTGMSLVPNLWLPGSGSHSKHASWEWPGF